GHPGEPVPRGPAGECKRRRSEACVRRHDRDRRDDRQDGSCDPGGAADGHLRESRAARLFGAQRVHGTRDATHASAAGDRPSDRGRRCGTRSGRHGGGGAGPGAHAGRPSGVLLQGQCGAGVLAVPISYLTRIVEFSATHYIRRADWPDERNAQEFGRAAVDHGHRYQCRVTVRGPLVAEAGGVMSLETLDRLLAEEITRRLDGRSINEALPEFAPGRRLATGEALGEPAVTWMCTPDQLEELATGWLHGEGYIESLDDLVKLRPCAPDLGFWAEVKPERVAAVKGENRKRVLASGCGAVSTFLAD